MGVNTPFVCVSRFKTGKNVNSMRDNTEKSIFHSILILCGNKSGFAFFGVQTSIVCAPFLI